MTWHLGSKHWAVFFDWAWRRGPSGEVVPKKGRLKAIKEIMLFLSDDLKSKQQSIRQPSSMILSLCAFLKLPAKLSRLVRDLRMESLAQLIKMDVADFTPSNLYLYGLWYTTEVQARNVVLKSIVLRVVSPLAHLFAWVLACWAIILLIQICWNIFLHSLSSHPGPKFWAASRLPWCWYQWRGLLNHRLTELHEVYGPVVRVAPDEISYTSETAWKSIYGQRSTEMSKDPVFSLNKPIGAQDLLTADRDTHARQRRLLAHAFSEKALREQESILNKYAFRLCEVLSSCSGPVDMKDWYNFAAFDLIGDLAFGQDFGCLAGGQAAPFVAAIPAGAQELTINQMLKFYRLLPLARQLKSLWTLKSIFSPGSCLGAREENMRRAVEVVRARISRGPTADRKDFWHFVLQNLNDDKTSEQGSNPTKRGITMPEIYANAFSITIAGSEGTATALAGATFLLLRHPHQYQRAVNEVREAFHTETEMTSSEIYARVPFIDSVLQEAMRLYPPVSITMPRKVPEGGEIIDGRFVAAGTTVGVNHLSCYRSSRNFAGATEFRPERWLRSSGTDASDFDNLEAFRPFSFGPRSCLGKNLAKAEMSLLLARILWRFDLQLVETEEGLSWLEKQRIWGFWKKPALLCRLYPAKR